MKFDTVLCNPPYNGEVTSVPIYHEFMVKFRDQSEQSAWLFPNTWIGNEDWSVGKSVRKSIDKMGVGHILMCPKSVFEPEARVTTCVCTCYGNPSNEIVFEDRKSRKSTILHRKQILNERIPYSFHQEEVDLLNKLREHGGEKLSGFDCKEGTWKIGPYNVNPSRQVSRPLGKLRLIDPNLKEAWMTYKWINFWEGETEEQANEIYPIVCSFWESKLVTFILNKTWMSYTVLPHIFKAVPIADYSQLWTDDELYAKYGLSEREIEIIEAGYLISDASDD